MSDTNKGMIAAINKYLQKVEDLIKGGGSGGGGAATAIIWASGALAPGETREWDLTTLIPAGSEVAFSSTVEVKMIDKAGATSLTNGYYIDASAVLTWGIHPTTNKLILANPSSGTVAYWIKVMAPHKKLNP